MDIVFLPCWLAVISNDMQATLAAWSPDFP